MPRQSVSTDFRNLFLGDITVEPSVQATIKKSSLEFSDLLYVDSVSLSGVDVGDDYFDENGHPVWGDIVRSTESPYKMLQMVTPAAWTGLSSNKMYYRYTQVGYSEDFDYSETTAPFTILPNTRIGLRQDGTNEDYWVYYVEYNASGFKLRKCLFTPSTATWGTPVTGLLYNADPTSFCLMPWEDPNGNWILFAAYYVPPFVFIKHTSDVGDWSYGWSGQDLHGEGAWMPSGLHALDITWGGVASIPEGASWGGTAGVVSRLHNGNGSTSNIMHQAWQIGPGFEIMPSSQYGSMRSIVSGVTEYTDGGRVWGVATRWAVGMDDEPYARHVSLISTSDMANWTDEAFITTSELRGKVLPYRANDKWVYVVGNASVARCELVPRMNPDATLPTKVYTVPSLTSFSASFSGAGSAPEFRMAGVSDDSINAFLSMGNEVEIYIGASGESAKYCVGEIVESTTVETAAGTEFGATIMGKSARLTGSLSYRPVGAKQYDGPYALYSNFNLANGTPRQTFYEESGTWTPIRDKKSARYAMYCKAPGIAILPRVLSGSGFILRFKFVPMVSIEGIYAVFWFHDKDNYWRAGVRRYAIDTQYHALYVEKITNGSPSAVYMGDWTDELALNTEYDFVATMEGTRLRVEIFEEDLSTVLVASSNTEVSGAFSITNDEPWPLSEWRVGVEIEAFRDNEGGLDYGTVDASGENWIQDTSKSFSAANLNGQWLSCGDHQRQISYVDGQYIYVRPNFSEPPTVGDDYAVYPIFEEGPLMPQALVREIFAFEQTQTWTLNSIMENMLALAAIDMNRDMAGATGVASGVSGTIHVDGAIDITFRGYAPWGASDNLYFYLWLTNQNESGSYQYAGHILHIDQYYAYLKHVKSNGTSQTVTTLYKQRTMGYGYSVGVDASIRVIANDQFVAVYEDAALVCAFPLKGVWTSGYVGFETNYVPYTSCSISEFGEVTESFIWDSGEELASAVSRLVNGRRMKVIEDEDGNVCIGKFRGNEGYYDGDYVSNLVQIDTRESLADNVSIVELEGATNKVFLINRGNAVGRTLRFDQFSNQNILGSPAGLMDEARWELIEAIGNASPVRYGLYSPDPGLMVEDWWYDSDRGENRVVDSIEWAISTGEGLQSSMNINTRLRESDTDDTVYDDAAAKFDRKEFAQ